MPIDEEVRFNTDGSEREVAEDLERAIMQALLQGATQGAKAAAKIINQHLGGATSKADPFAKANRGADEFARKTDRVRQIIQDIERRAAGMARNLDGAFDVQALAGVDRDLARMRTSLGNVSDESELLDVNMRRAFDSIQRAARGSTFGDLQAQFLAFRQLRLETNERVQAEQNATRIFDRESRERVVQAQQEGAQTIAATRAASQQRVALIQTAGQQIRALERGLGTVFGGTARAIASSFSGIGGLISRGLGGASAPIQRFNTELNQNFATSLSRRESTLRQSFSTQERAISSSVSRSTATIERFERQLSTGALGAITGRSAAAGALGFGGISAIAGGAGLAGLLTSGFQRYSALEGLNRQFVALTGSAEQTASLMQQIKDFAKVTPFDLVGVAGLAKGFLAIGTAAEDVLPQVRTIADAVALTGGGTDALERIQRAIGQVVSAGRLQGDELNQLAENLPGLNIRQILADQLTGGDVQALVKMQEAGELTADKFVTGLMTGLSTDPRIAGASEALGGTLGGQFANLKEQFAEFGATLIGLVAKPMAVVFSTINTGLAAVSQFIKGEELTPFLELLRTAATGATLALGGLVVARVAGEALQVLALAVSRVLTPFGLLITVVGAIGAAIAVLTKASPALREALGDTVEILGSAFRLIGAVALGAIKILGEALGISFDSIGEFGDFLAEKLTEINAKLSDFVENRLAPVMVEVIRAVVSFFQDKLIPAVGAVVSFIVDTAVPALVGAFGAVKDFVTGTLVPVVTGVAGAIADFVSGPFVDGVVTLATGVRAAYRTIEPIIKPLVDGLKAVGDAVTDFDFSDVGESFGRIGSAIATLGSGVLDTLGNIGSEIVERLRSAFEKVQELISDVDWLDLGKGLLGVLEEVGYQIGRFATSPAFLGAVAKIVGALVVAVGSAVFRFGEGLIRGIASNLGDWMRRAFDGLADALELAFRAAFENLPQVILGLVGGLFAVATMRRIFTDYGAGAGQGFLGGFRSALQGAGGTAAGFGTTTGGFITGLFRGPSGIQTQMARETAQTETQLRSSIQRMRDVLGAVGRDPIRVATPDIAPQALRGNLGTVQREFDQFIAKYGPGGEAAIRMRQAGRGLMDAFVAPFSGTPIRESMRHMGTALAEGGKVLASQAGVLGRAIAGGIASGFAGFQIGRQAGQAGGLLEALLGIGSSAAIGGAVGGPWGAVAGGIAATVGVAFGRIGAAAEEAERHIREYVDALKGLEGVEFEKALDAHVLEQFNKELPPVRDLLLDLGFNARDMAQAFQDGNPAMRGFIADLIDGIGPASADIADKLRSGELSIKDFARAVKYGKGDFADFSHEIRDSGINTEVFRDAMDLVLDESGEFRGAMQANSDSARASGEAFAEGADRMQSWTRSYSPFTEAARNARDELNRPIANPYDQMLGVILSATEGLEGFGAAQQEIDTNAMQSETNAIIRESERRIEAARKEAETLNDELDEFFGRGTNTTFQNAINDIIIGLESLDLDNLDLNIGIDRAKFSNQIDAEVRGFLEAMRVGIENGEVTAIPQIEMHREALLQEMERAMAASGGGLSQNEIDYLAQVRLGITEIVNAGELPGLLEQKIAENTPTTGVKIDFPVEFTIKYLLEGGTPVANDGSTPQIFGFAGGGGTGALGGKVKPSFLGLPDKLAVDLPVDVNPIPNMVPVGIAIAQQIAAGVVGGAGFVVNAVAAITGSAQGAAVGGGANIARAVGAGVSAAAAFVTNALAITINAGLTTVARSYDAFFKGGYNISRALSAGTAGIGSSIAFSVGTAINNALRYAAGSYNSWYGIGLNMGRALGAGVGATINYVASAAVAVVRSAILAAQATAKIKSPSQVFMDIGQNMGAGMAIGVANSTGAVVGATTEMVSRAVNAAGQVWMQFEDGSAGWKNAATWFGESVGETIGNAVGNSTTTAIASSITAAEQALGYFREALAGERDSAALDVNFVNGRRLARLPTANQEWMNFEDGSSGWRTIADAITAATVQPQPVTAGTMTGIVEASGGTSTNVTLVVEGNIYGDKALDDKLTGAMDEIGSMMTSRPRVASGFGG
jgi:tape measure domain-containing protein